MKDNDMLIERNNEIGVLKNISVDLDTLIFYDELGLKIKAYRFN
jgi:hypothetical protein